MNKRLGVVIAAVAVVVAGAITGTAIVSYNNGMRFADAHPLTRPTVTLTPETVTVTTTESATAATVAATTDVSGIGPVNRAKCRTIMQALRSSGADLMADQIVAGGTFTVARLMQPIATVQLALNATSNESDADLPGMVSVRATSQKLADLLLTPGPDETELYAYQLAFALSVTGLSETCASFTS